MLLNNNALMEQLSISLAKSDLHRWPACCYAVDEDGFGDVDVGSGSGSGYMEGTPWTDPDGPHLHGRLPCCQQVLASQCRQVCARCGGGLERAGCHLMEPS